MFWYADCNNSKGKPAMFSYSLLYWFFFFTLQKETPLLNIYHVFNIFTAPTFQPLNICVVCFFFFYTKADNHHVIFFPMWAVTSLKELIFCEVQQNLEHETEKMLFEVYAENLCSATHQVWSWMSTSVWVVLIDCVYEQI